MLQRITPTNFIQILQTLFPPLKHLLYASKSSANCSVNKLKSQHLLHVTVMEALGDRSDNTFINCNQVGICQWLFF